MSELNKHNWVELVDLNTDYTRVAECSKCGHRYITGRPMIDGSEIKDPVQVAVNSKYIQSTSCSEKVE